MQPERVTVENHEAFGKLVKRWVNDPSSRPKDLTEFKAQAAEAGVGLHVPAHYEYLRLTQRTTRVVELMLPPAGYVESAEAAIKEGGMYPLPSFYAELFRAPLPELTADEKMKLHAQRIADYTTGQCG